jgi:hypothetical protein
MKYLIILSVVLVLVGFCHRATTLRDVTEGCQKVCGDLGYEHDYSYKTGVFTYACKCRNPKPSYKGVHN